MIDVSIACFKFRNFVKDNDWKIFQDMNWHLKSENEDQNHPSLMTATPLRASKFYALSAKDSTGGPDLGWIDQFQPLRKKYHLLQWLVTWVNELESWSYIVVFGGCVILKLRGRGGQFDVSMRSEILRLAVASNLDIPIFQAGSH